MKYEIEVIRTVRVVVDTEDSYHYDLDDADVDDLESIAAEMAIFDAEDSPNVQEEEALSVSVRIGSVTQLSQ